MHTCKGNRQAPLAAEFAYFLYESYHGHGKMPSSADSKTSEFRDAGPPVRERDVLRGAVEQLRERLPPTWTLDISSEPRGRDPRVDAELRLSAPDGGEVTVLVEAKRLLNTRDVPVALDALRSAAARRGTDDDPVLLLAARYLAPATRERIEASGAGYVDLTGNLQLANDRPALLIRDRGADRDPWRGPGRPRGTLKGPPAARVVRALTDFAPPYTVPELAARAGASTGATYRVVEFLEEQELLDRQPRGPITGVRWRGLLERWSRDYGFAQSNTVATFLEPRGLTALTDRLRERPELDYVLTGSLAAERVASYAPARLAMLYVRDIAAAAKLLELRPTESGANVALAAGDYDIAFERDQTVNGLRFAALSQVVVDLLTGPGRNPSEATALLDWMASDESAWRR